MVALSAQMSTEPMPYVAVPISPRCVTLSATRTHNHATIAATPDPGTRLRLRRRLTARAEAPLYRCDRRELRARRDDRVERRSRRVRDEELVEPDFAFLVVPRWIARLNVRTEQPHRRAYSVTFRESAYRRTTSRAKSSTSRSIGGILPTSQ